MKNVLVQEAEMKTHDTHDSVEEEVTTNIDFDTDVDGTNLLVKAKMTKMT